MNLTNLSKEVYYVFQEGGFVYARVISRCKKIPKWKMDCEILNVNTQCINFKVAIELVEFIDFDWAGNAGEVKYPFSLNMYLPWHPDIKPCVNILPEHDKDTLEKCFLDVFCANFVLMISAI